MGPFNPDIFLAHRFVAASSSEGAYNRRSHYLGSHGPNLDARLHREAVPRSTTRPRNV